MSDVTHQQGGSDPGGQPGVGLGYLGVGGVRVGLDGSLQTFRF